MISIFIQGMKDGQREIDLEIPVSNVPEFDDMFFGNIHIEGILRKLGNRFSLVIDISCKAKLICDRSLEEYEDEINGNLKLSFISDTTLLKLGGNSDNSEEVIIRTDDKSIDITNEVKEILIVNIPMKRIAPQYRRKNFEELYPEYSSKSAETETFDGIDERWEVLKNLKLNN